MSKRVMIAGTGSGCGKTTITCALLAALASSGKDVVSFKCGPDYIDPMFHEKATGVKARNLDIFLMGEGGVKDCLSRNARGRDVAVLEGVMGFYDGLGGGSVNSSNHISLLTGTPVVLIVNAKGAALSVCAAIKGFLEFEENNISGVILNDVSESAFDFYKKMIEERFDIGVLGFMPHIPEVKIESRHLGLVTAGEIADIKEKINVLEEYAKKCVDMERLLHIAGQAGALDCRHGFLHIVPVARGVKLYIALDEAFSFWYEDNSELLEALGAEVRFFSPLHDKGLPEDADGLVLPGGYPELYGQALENNSGMRDSLKHAIENGLPVYAECGGFVYMQRQLTDFMGRTHEMLGALPGNVKMTDRLQNFGYYRIEAQEENMLCGVGDGINAHFFRCSVSDSEGDRFIAVKHGGKSFSCIVAEGNVFAGYQHLHFLGNPDFAKKFIKTCSEYSDGRDGK